MSSGFITNYIQQSDGTFDCTLNTLDLSGNTTSIYLSNINLIKNDWCLSSTNNIDQILVMTNDSKYIYVPSIPFMISKYNNTLYKTLITLCTDLYIIGNSSSKTSVTAIGTGIPVGLPKTLKNAAQLAMYIYIYFFINNGIGSYTSTSKIASLFQNQTFTLDKNDPNYNKWNELPNDTDLSIIIKQMFLMYAICMNYKNYMYMIDSSGVLSTNLNESNWQYVGNFFKTIYELYSYDTSNFCINLTGNIEHIIEILSPSSSPSSFPSSSPFSFNSSSPSSSLLLYIPECVDCRIVSLNANTNINTPNSLCNPPSISTTLTYTPEEIQQMNTTFSSTICILIIILIIITLITWYFNRNNISSTKTNNNYYYI